MCRFDGFAEETVTVQRLPGWFKQRSNRLYPVRALLHWMSAEICTWLASLVFKTRQWSGAS